MTDTTNPSSPRAKWTTVSWKRVALALLLIFGGFGAVSLALEFIEPWYVVRQSLRDAPELSVVPAQPRDMSASPLTSARFECYGYSFGAPWTLEQRTDKGSLSTLWFGSDITLTVPDPASISSIAQSMRRNEKQFEPEFGPQVLDSDYEWLAAELAATPADLHFWDRKHNLRAAMFLAEKAPEVAERRAIYRINSENLRGFQVGDPSRDWRTTLYLFDAKDHQYKLEFISQTSETAKISQADINAVVASMRPIPHT